MDREGDPVVEWDEIPEKYRGWLREDGECWVPAKHRCRAWQPAPMTEKGRMTLRRILWERDTGGDATGRRLHQQCGTRDCHRPEHLRLGNAKTLPRPEYNRQAHERMARVKYWSDFELRQAIEALERRGFTRFGGTDRSVLPVRTYRIGRGRRGPVSRRFPGPWWLYWQEPLRPAASKAAQRRAA